MSTVFEHSLNDLAPDAVLECGVCWWVYDPDKGDEINDIAPGTAFSDLPEHWRCPKCDTEKAKFLVAAPGNAPRLETQALPSAKDRLAELVRAYEKAEDAIVGLPVHNARLRIEPVGFREFDDAYVGVMVTPWSMNIVLLPQDPKALPHNALGGSRQVVFPSGGYGFIAGRMDGVGHLETCSLFSPMDEFDDMDVAIMAAHSAMEGLFTPEKPDEKKQPTRRFLFTVNGEAR